MSIYALIHTDKNRVKSVKKGRKRETQRLGPTGLL